MMCSIKRKLKEDFIAFEKICGKKKDSSIFFKEIPKIRKKCCGLPKLFHLVGALGSVWWWGGPPATLLLLWLLLLYSWRSGGKEKKERVGIFLSFPLSFYIFILVSLEFWLLLPLLAADSIWLSFLIKEEIFLKFKCFFLFRLLYRGAHCAYDCGPKLLEMRYVQ